MKSLNLAGSIITLPDRAVTLSGLGFVGDGVGFHIEVFVGYMSLLYSVLHSLVPRYAFHEADKSMMLMEVLPQFFQLHPIPSIQFPIHFYMV